MPLSIGKLAFRSPVLTASGTFGMGDVFSDFFDYAEIGGITLKTVTEKARSGNKPPRVLETPAGLLNSIGLENAGFAAVLSSLQKEDKLKALNTNVIFSIAGDSVGGFAEMAKAFSEIEGISMLELNLSCPNVHAGGKTFDSSAEIVFEITRAAKKATKKPFSIKLSPQQDIVANALAAERGGADAVTVSNTFLGMAMNRKTGKPYFQNIVAGFSGPAVKPMALLKVYQVAREVKIPIIASGGIASVDDANDFLMAGASFLSVGTFGFVEPDFPAILAKSL